MEHQKKEREGDRKMVGRRMKGGDGMMEEEKKWPEEVGMREQKEGWRKEEGKKDRRSYLECH